MPEARTADAPPPEAVREEFRHAFARTPIVWYVEGAGDAVAAAVAGRIRRCVVEAGHLLGARPMPPAEQLPGPFCPLAQVTIAPRAHGSAVTDHTIPSAPRVLRHDLPLTGDVGPWLAPLADDIRRQALAAILADADRPAPAAFAVSAVVCTYRRAAALADALASLATQTLDPAHFEVLVVNNDPSDQRTVATVDAVRSRHFAGRPERLRLITCPHPGLSFARNAAVARARGDILSFLDDDAVARPEWLARVRDAFAGHPHAGVVGGRITLAPPAPRPRWALPAWGRYWSEHATDFDDVRIANHWWHYPFGANWSAPRGVLLAVGGFRTAYGRTGQGAAGGEEIVAAALIHRLGFAVVVDPAAEVLHRPEGTRFTLGHVWRRIQSAKREELAQERAGYIPRTMTPATVARRSLARVRLAAARGRVPAATRLEHLLHACADARLLPDLLHGAPPRRPE